MAELLGRVERLGSTGGQQQQISGQAQVNSTGWENLSKGLFFEGAGTVASSVPGDVARIEDINRVINANTEMTRTIQSFA